MPVDASSATPAPAPEPALHPTDSGQGYGAAWVAADAPVDVGLAGLRAHLDRTLEALDLRSLTVVVDDPDLGRQAFRAGSGSIDAGVVAAGPGCASDPPLPAERVDAELLVALCAASLRVDVLRGSSGDSVELALRMLPGVSAVTLERDGDVTVCRLLAGADAPEDVARQAATALAGEPRLVVELVRDPITARGVDVPTARSEHGAGAAVGRTGGGGPELLSVRSVPEDGEIEVHLAVGPVRAIGRAPLARGLAGSAAAVLAAVSEAEAGPSWSPSWIRTVETTANGTFVVAVALMDPATDTHRHGIATGSSPIDAAARATVDALTGT
jgi:hypothetical protein